MAKTSRFSRMRGRNEERRVLLMEISRRNDPEALMMLAEEAMRALEDPNCDELTREAMRGLLIMSSAICKYWRFYTPPSVEVEFVFDNQQYADEFAEKAGKIMKARRATRAIDGKTYPSVRVDWTHWHAMKIILGAPIEPPDIIAENFIRQKSPRKALKRLIEDIALFSATIEEHLETSEDNEVHQGGDA